MTVVVAGHYPPPVHGMAVAVAAFADRAELVTDVVRIDLAGGASRNRAHHHLRRARRVAVANIRLVALRRRARSLYLSCDAGLGMLYTISLLVTARLLRYRRFVHHHSYAHVRARTPLMATLVLLAGRRCHHLVLCEGMATGFRSRYPRADHVELLPCAYAVEGADDVARDDPGPATVVIGHLGNLTRDKGLDTVLATAAEAERRGLTAELVIAGPTSTPADRASLDAGLAALTSARYLGAVHGDDKRAFFASLDVFVIPSTYSHEAAPIVALEALAHGVPVVAFDRGCLGSTAVDPGFMVDEASDFARTAVDVLARWFPQRRAELAGRSRQRFAELRAESDAAADKVIDLLGARSP